MGNILCCNTVYYKVTIRFHNYRKIVTFGYNSHKLIVQLCPEGVEFEILENLGSTYSGLKGKSKVDFNDWGARFVTYRNIFNNISVDLESNNFVRVAKGERQNYLEVGDVLFTGSSETLDEVGMSSVVLDTPSEEIFLNSFCFGYRFKDKALLIPGFSKYVFRSDVVRKQIVKSASGVTRFNVSKKRFLKGIRIPLPPLEIQHEIARILDTFTGLEADLEAELEARRKQYQYYRDALLSFDRLVRIGVKFQEIGTLTERTHNIRWQDSQGEEFKYIDLTSVDRRTHTIGHTKTINSKSAPSRAQRVILKDDVIFGTTRPMLKRYCLVPQRYTEQICSTGYCVLRPKTCLLHPHFLLHILGTDNFYTHVEAYQRGTSYPAISDSAVKKYRIPLPPLEVQHQIVEKLDKFDAIVNDLSIGLPAEINARRKQYEYYRDRLLTFKEAA